MNRTEDFIDIAERIGHDLFCVQLTYDTLMDLNGEDHDAAMARIEDALTEGDATCHCDKPETPASDEDDECPLPAPEAWTPAPSQIATQQCPCPKCGAETGDECRWPDGGTCVARVSLLYKNPFDGDDSFEAMDQTGRGVAW